MAAVVPITSRVDGQVSLLATTVVTALGGRKARSHRDCGLNLPILKKAKAGDDHYYHRQHEKHPFSHDFPLNIFTHGQKLKFPPIGAGERGSLT
jgi:hypothetical protein